MLATDSAEFGIVRIIVDDANKAKDLLTKAGYQCRIDFVIAVDMASDAPGTLNKILDSLNQANVNIRYLYISFDRKTSNPIVRCWYSLKQKRKRSSWGRAINW